MQTPEQAPDTAAGRVPPRGWLLVAVMCAAALGLRLLGARGDLWLDEIWSLHFALKAPGWSTILLGPGTDNNHALNTLWLRLCGDVRPHWLYRLPAILAGTGMVAAAAWWGQRRHEPGVVLWAALMAVSFLFVTWGSEARGYGLMLLFAVAAFLFAFGEGEKPQVRAVAFLVVCVLGMLSHLEFLGFLLPALGLIAWRGMRESALPRRQIAVWLLPPLAAIGAVYWFHWRPMEVVGGSPRAVWPVMAEAYSVALGGPRAPLMALVFVVGFFALAAAAPSDSWRHRLVAPALLGALTTPVGFALLQPDFAYTRYFLISILFLYLLFAILLTDALKNGGWRRGAAVALLAVFALGNARHMAPFMMAGRGSHSRAVREMAAASNSRVILIGYDAPFRNSAVFGYYLRTVEGGDRFLAHPQARWGEVLPEYVILSAEYAAPDHIEPAFTVEGVEFLLFGLYPFAGESGYNWIVYQRP